MSRSAITGMNQLGGGSRSGAALVVVLGATVVMIALLVPVLEVLVSTEQRAVLDQRDLAFDGLRTDAEAVVSNWLAVHGATMVTDPDQAYAGQQIIDLQPTASESDVAVRAWVWDGYSAWPVAALRPGHPLARSRPPLLAGVGLPPGERQREQVPRWLANLAPRWPSPPPLSGDQVQLGVVPVLAMHAESEINLRTAPAGLIQAAAVWLERPALEHWLVARREGVGMPTTDPTVNDERLGIRTSSNRWLVMLELKWQQRRQVWCYSVQVTDDGIQIMWRERVASER